MHINEVPIYKRISTYTIDCFKIEVEGCSHYFLTHFHTDHYYGLKSKFPHTIYCSPTTSNLLRLKYKVKTEPLEMFKEYFLKEDESVMLIDAHHCPGAVSLVFKIQGEYILHTGDFRSTPAFLSQIVWNIQTVYLDNTYEGFRPFGTQKEAIHRVIRVIEGCLRRPCIIPLKYTFMFCTYSVGKEKIFLSAGEYFSKSIRVSKEKKKIYDCYDEYTITKLNKEVEEMIGIKNNSFSRITSEEEDGQFVVISTFQNDKVKINNLLGGKSPDRVVVFCCTGWKDTVKYYDLIKKNRVAKKGIEVHYIPYSEHSSSDELRIFKETIKPLRIVNTVKMKSEM